MPRNRTIFFLQSAVSELEIPDKRGTFIAETWGGCSMCGDLQLVTWRSATVTWLAGDNYSIVSNRTVQPHNTRIAINASRDVYTRYVESLTSRVPQMSTHHVSDVLLRRLVLKEKVGALVFTARSLPYSFTMKLSAEKRVLRIFAVQMVNIIHR